MSRTKEEQQNGLDYAPVEKVRRLICDQEEEVHTPKLFIQLDELHEPVECHKDNEFTWREMGRWIKYEETVEGRGERWSKPHVASLPLHSTLELRRSMMDGIILLDSEAKSLEGIADAVIGAIKDQQPLGCHEDYQMLRTTLISPHIPQQSNKEINLKMPGIQITTPSSHGSKNPSTAVSVEELDKLLDHRKQNKHLLKKLPEGSEAANIMVGHLPVLHKMLFVFLRLNEPVKLPDTPEVPLKSRFIVLILGPKRQAYPHQYYQIGRAIATLLCDEVFRDVSFKAKKKDDLLAGIDEFLDSVTLLPPDNWDASVRIEPPKNQPPSRLKHIYKVVRTAPVAEGDPDDDKDDIPFNIGENDSDSDSSGDDEDPQLARTGRLFGGLVRDVKRRAPLWLSDFKDALHPQCLASFVFLYFAALTPIITFGGLLGHGTDNYMATMECILAGAICGITYHLFSGQPLNVLGPTGPMLVLEVIIYHYSEDHHFNYLAFRFWIGLWTTILILLIVAFDLSYLVKYITRFTEEAFACLISTIFIYDAFSKLIHIHETSPIDRTHEGPIQVCGSCTCNPPNLTIGNYTELLIDAHTEEDDMYGSHYHETDSHMDPHSIENLIWVNLTREECLINHGALEGPGCDTGEYVADVFLMSVLLFIATYAIATALHNFRGSSYFPSFVRSVSSDFAVFIAIILCSGIDWITGIDTPKLHAPTEFHPTRQSKRGWLINPLDGIPWWLTLAALLPALLATILIFMDQQITAVIVNRKDNKMRKGAGYHLDMFILAFLVLTCSLLGLPWFVASTVVAITHVTSLREESHCAAPGEKPLHIGVREQRVTGIAAHLMIGLSVLFTPLLKHVPMPVLYGVFLYMGVSSLTGLQLVDRLKIMLMPVKYQPDFDFLRKVPTRRIHLFTFIQVVCLAILWVVKKIKVVSIAFPVMVLALCVVRKVVLGKIFTYTELRILDNVLPQSAKEKEEAAMKMQEISMREKEMMDLKGVSRTPDRDDNMNGSAMKINVSEEVTTTGLWKQLLVQKLRHLSPPKQNDDLSGSAPCLNSNA